MGPRLTRLAKRTSQSSPAQRVLSRLEARHDDVLRAVGRLECHLLDARQAPPERLEDVEFKVYSQFGEDGILQYLIRQAKVPDTTFVEIGVGDYRESNTRFLVENNNWRGLAIDGGPDHVRFVLNSALSWRYDVEPVQAFVTRENVNDLIRDNGFVGEIGLLSVDVDGVDYWLWQAIDIVRPAIVVVEYNALFGPDATVTVPYDPSFVNSEAHYSQAYFGCSVGALAHLAEQRGYRLVGCASNAANAFFVRDDAAGNLPALTSQEAWRPARFLTSRTPEGTLSRIRDTNERLRMIAGLHLIDVSTGADTTVGAVFGGQ